MAACEDVPYEIFPASAMVGIQKIDFSKILGQYLL